MRRPKTLVSGLRQAVQVAFAGAIDALAEFGLKPRKVRVTTPAQKAAAAAKALLSDTGPTANESGGAAACPCAC